MPAPSRTKLQRLEERQRIAELALAGHTQREIAGQLGRTRVLIEYDLRVLRQQWQRQASVSIAEERARLLAECRQLRRELWDAWRTSGTDRQITTTRQKKRGLNGAHSDVPLDQVTEASKRSESRERNPAYADRIAALLEFEGRILGVVQQQQEVSRPTIIEVTYEAAPVLPDRGRLVVIGNDALEALPEPDDSETA